MINQKGELKNIRVNNKASFDQSGIIYRIISYIYYSLKDINYMPIHPVNNNELNTHSIQQSGGSSHTIRPDSEGNHTITG